MAFNRASSKVKILSSKTRLLRAIHKDHKIHGASCPATIPNGGKHERGFRFIQPSIKSITVLRSKSEHNGASVSIIILSAEESSAQKWRSIHWFLHQASTSIANTNELNWFQALAPPSVGTTLAVENSRPLSLCSVALSLHVSMLAKKKKHHPAFALYFKAFHRLRSVRNRALLRMKNKSISLVDLSDIGVAAFGSSAPVTSSSPAVTFVSPRSIPERTGSPSGLPQPLKEVSSPALLSSPSPLGEGSSPRAGSKSVPRDSTILEDISSQAKNYAAMLKSSAQLYELGTPTEHISGAPFVLIPDENIEAAKLEFKDFIYARFHGEYPSMGKIIGVVNAVWARTGPRIFVHKIGQGIYLLRVSNPRTREVLLSRTCWNIGGLPMFVAPWSPDFSPDEPQLTSVIVPVEMHNVPYLLFNRQSLSRLATAIGKPESLAPETERKENFEVAKLFVRVDVTAPLPHRIVSGFSNGKEVQIEVSYPWLPVKCDSCKKNPNPETARSRSKSRPGRTRNKKGNKPVLYYAPVARDRQVSPDGNEAINTATVSLEATVSSDGIPSAENQMKVLLVVNHDCPVASDPRLEVAVSSHEDEEATTSVLPVNGSDAPDGKCASDNLLPATGTTATMSNTKISEKDDNSQLAANRLEDYLRDLANKQDREEPFLLVKNRKSSRKATKHH
ncbi:hypothetical protein F2Q69_00040577 [Brassica cretica]|uniref:DUF4283 domain-containing protein n=1 Tax=Brassica cretica TaxID=69181 RepID=A0A8S9NG66_BRACR|nr:hypothetical protein F2Q69_00040577 [Brassica cretica]